MNAVPPGSVLFCHRTEQLVLLPEKAIWLPEHQALLVADIHLGKVGHFRKHGLGVPSDGGLDDLERLSQLMDRLRPRQLFILGDLFHSELNEEWEPAKAWFQRQESTIILVEGNHDILQTSVYTEAGLIVKPEGRLGSLIFSHEPLNSVAEGWLNIAGHIHPGVRLSGKGRQSLRLPCFHRQGARLILPAFGKWTGLYLLPPEKEDEIFAIADEQVIQVL